MNRDKTVMLVDMDGVLADFDGLLYRIFDGLLDCTPETQVHRFLTDHLVNPSDRKQMRDTVESDGWFRDLPVMEGAKEGIEFLFDHDYDVWVVSKPLEASRSCASDKFAWIERHFPQLVGRLILAPDKGMVKGDFLIDDAIKPSWLAYADWDPIIFDHPWNRQGVHALLDHRPCHRMHGWDIQLLEEDFG